MMSAKSLLWKWLMFTISFSTYICCMEQNFGNMSKDNDLDRILSKNLVNNYTTRSINWNPIWTRDKRGDRSLLSSGIALYNRKLTDEEGNTPLEVFWTPVKEKWTLVVVGNKAFGLHSPSSR